MHCIHLISRQASYLNEMWPKGYFTLSVFFCAEFQNRILKMKRNVLISWTHEIFVVVESLALRLFVAVSTTVNCSRLQDQIASVSNTRMGSCAIFSSLKESKNSIMSAAVPMYTSSSWDSWSLVRSPGRQSHVIDFSYISRLYPLDYFVVWRNRNKLRTVEEICHLSEASSVLWWVSAWGTVRWGSPTSLCRSADRGAEGDPAINTRWDKRGSGDRILIISTVSLCTYPHDLVEAPEVINREGGDILGLLSGPKPAVHLVELK